MPKLEPVCVKHFGCRTSFISGVSEKPTVVKFYLLTNSHQFFFLIHFSAPYFRLVHFVCGYWCFCWFPLCIRYMLGSHMFVSTYTQTKITTETTKICSARHTRRRTAGARVKLYEPLVPICIRVLNKILFTFYSYAWHIIVGFGN